jgi:hypothetical protein
MAAENWRERLTEADWKNWQAAYDRWVERDARAWALTNNELTTPSEAAFRPWAVKLRRGSANEFVQVSS